MVVARRFDADPYTRSEDRDRLPEPTGFTCTYCEEAVSGDLVCQGCGACHTHCPFCGNCEEGGCEHLLQNDGDEDIIFSVLTHMGVPDWPEDGEWGIAEAEPYLEEAFGGLRSLVEDETYGSGPYGLRYLMPELVHRIAAPVSTVRWLCDKPMVSHSGSDYYTDDPEQARAELAAIVARLKAGFGAVEAALSYSADDDEAPAQNT